MMRIWEGDENVLVGAIDEITPNSHAIQQRLGLLRGIQAGEGAQFFLLGREATESTLAELAGISTFIHANSTQEVAEKVHCFLQSNRLTAGQIDWFVTGKNGNSKEDTLYTDLENDLFPTATCSIFKNECGEYPTVSSFALWKVAKTFEENLNPGRTVLIYNHYHSINHSLILIRKRQ